MTTKAEKRVAIAKDVIKQLELKKLVATPGTYFSISQRVAEKLKPTAQLQKELKKIPKCEVCALGACFVSAVRKFNDLTVQEVELGKYNDELGLYTSSDLGRDGTTDKLNEFFEPEQLNRIEQAFEGWDRSVYHNDEYGTVAFYAKYPNATRRMKAIMQNIIRNKGEFIPKDL